MGFFFQVNNDSHSSNTIIEIESDNDSISSCEIIGDHHKSTGIEVNILTFFINALIKYLIY